MPRSRCGFMSRPLWEPKRSRRKAASPSSTRTYRPRASLSNLLGTERGAWVKAGRGAGTAAARGTEEGEAARPGAGGRLDGLVLLRGDVEVDGPEPGGAEGGFRRRRGGVGRSRERVCQQAGREQQAEPRGGRGEESSGHEGISQMGRSIPCCLRCD